MGWRIWLVCVGKICNMILCFFVYLIVVIEMWDLCLFNSSRIGLLSLLGI